MVLLAADSQDGSACCVKQEVGHFACQEKGYFQFFGIISLKFGPRRLFDDYGLFVYNRQTTSMTKSPNRKRGCISATVWCIQTEITRVNDCPKKLHFVQITSRACYNSRSFEFYIKSWLSWFPGSCWFLWFWKQEVGHFEISAKLSSPSNSVRRLQKSA